MILPKKFNKPQLQPKTKYEDPNNVKMFLLSCQDLHTNRFKNGWFTLLKFTEQVKLQPSLMDEMRQFGLHKLEKPVVEVYYQIAKKAEPVKTKAKFVKRNLQIGAAEEEGPTVVVEAPVVIEKVPEMLSYVSKERSL